MVQTAGVPKVVLKDFLGGSSGFGRQLSTSWRVKGLGLGDCVELGQQ